MEISGKREFDLLSRIGFVRMAGSPQEKQAAEILMDEVRSAGAEPVCEEFEIQDADIVKAELEILRPFNKKYTVTAYKLSESTPEEGITAPFYYAEGMTAADIEKSAGKIILVNGGMNMDLYRKVRKSKAVAFITMSGTLLETEENSDLFTRTLRSAMREFGNMPGANIRTTDAFEIVKNGATQARLTVINTPKTLTSRNVIATVKGTEKPEEVVVFGAHFDSVEFSTGVYDNGAGSVIIMEMLRHFVKNPPKRTVRFCWFGSEEIGLEGSKAFVRDHKDELENVIFMINVDVGGCVIGHDTARLIATVAATNHADIFMQRNGYTVDVKQDIYSSDGIPFADNGIPSISFIRSGMQIGGAFIHCRNDVIDYLSAEALEKTTKFVLGYADEAVNSVVFPVERVIPPEMVEKVDKYLNKKAIEEARSGKKY